MKNSILIFSLTLFIASCNVNESIISDLKSLDSIVSKYVDNKSQALLLVRLEGDKGDVIYQYSDKNESLVPDHDINENTWFRIWSMSKIVTISITMDLVEDGFLKLDDTVSKYIPEFSDLKVAVANNGKPLTGYGQLLGNDKSENEDPCPIKLV